MHLACIDMLGLVSRYAKKQQRTCCPQGMVLWTPTLELFISYAQTRYKFSTTKSIMSALIDWHKSKGAEYSAVTCNETKMLLATVQSEQSPAGLPAGKQGLTKPMLRLLIQYLNSQRKHDPAMATILLRDECVILLGI